MNVSLIIYTYEIWSKLTIIKAYQGNLSSYLFTTRSSLIEEFFNHQYGEWKFPKLLTVRVLILGGFNIR